MDKRHSGIERAKNAVAGTAGGMVQVLVGQPLDLIKVRLQTQSYARPEYSGVVDCVLKTYKNEGIFAFYKGTLAPLLGIGACVATQFTAFHETRRYIEHRKGSAGLSYPQYYVSGAAAGLANSFISGPMEMVRIRLQTQRQGPNGPQYAGPLDCMRQLGPRGILRGQTVTMLREMQGYGCWFLVYEYTVREWARMSNQARQDLAGWKIYPLDVAKSRVQTTTGQHQYGLFATLRSLYREGALWRGILPTLLRAAPASAATFMTVETVQGLLGQNQQ